MTTIVGRLVDLLNRQRVDEREVALLGRLITSEGEHDLPGHAEVVLRTTTDAHGRFIGATPEGRFIEAFALLDDASGRIPVELNPDGTFPDEIVIFLNTLDSHLRYMAL